MADKCKIFPYPFIYISPDTTNVYNMLSNYCKHHETYDKNNKGKLLLTKIHDLTNKTHVYKLIWGYKSDPNNSISLEELRAIKFISNLGILLEENCVLNWIGPIDAIIAIISSHFKKNTYWEKINTSDTPHFHKINVYLSKDEDKFRWY